MIIGSLNAITYKEFFPLLKNNKVWLGYNHVKEFLNADSERQKFGNVLWYTNLDHNKRHEDLLLYKKYNPEEFPKYDNYDAINVDKVSDIPVDYDGVMGVPITFLDKYNSEQFEILGIDAQFTSDGGRGKLNGKSKYVRILIKYTSKWISKYPIDFYKILNSY